MINLTYIITTRNKVDFLKISLTYLLKYVDEDDEIIIIDGNSTDGTMEYLKTLNFNGIIHSYISEPDYGEAHGFNKGFLLARGKLIKVITDDDYFNYEAIKECKKFMLEKTEIDLLIGTTYNTFLENFDSIILQSSVKENYINWLNSAQCFPFTGLSMMIRKSSIPLLGLFNCTSIVPDTEFSLRVTSLNINLAWCELPIVIRIDNLKSNLRIYSHKNKNYEADRTFYFYDKRFWDKRNSFFKNTLYIIKLYCTDFVAFIKSRNISCLFFKKQTEKIEIFEIDKFFHKCSQWVDNQIKEYSPNFIYKNLK